VPADFHVARPELRQRLAHIGLADSGAVRALTGEIISGHRDRHVLDVRIGRTRAILKKEHRVSWLLRLRNWMSGYGWVGLSEREAQNLVELADAGVPVPDWAAVGASFLLLRREGCTRDLATVLRRDTLVPAARRRLARNIGAAVARVHDAGFDAPDLAAKHVLVRPNGSVILVDWPRARRHWRLDGWTRLRDLAGLLASLPPDSVSRRELVIALRAYWKDGSLGPAARTLVRLAQASRHRQMANCVRAAPRLRWLAGEALCVTRALQERLRGGIPRWLHRAAMTPVARTSTRRAGRFELIRFAPAPRWRQLLARLTGRPLRCPSVRLAGRAFADHRRGGEPHGILAFGTRPDGGGFMLRRRREAGRPTPTAEGCS